MNTSINKILVVVESIDVDDSSGSKGRVNLIKNLNKAGYIIEVFHYTRKDIYLEGIRCIAIKEKRNTPMFFLSRTERFLRKKLNFDIHKSLEKIFGFSFTVFNDRDSIVSGLNEIHDFKPDLIITLSKGGSFRPHHALLKMPEWHHKWLAYIHDPYPMHLYPRPFAWVEPGYYKKWKFIKDISEKAAFSAFPSKILQDWMGSYFPNFNNTGVVIPHQIAGYETYAIKHPVYFNPDNFNLLHAGTLLDQRNPSSLINGFQMFLEHNPKAKKHAYLILLGGKNIYTSWLDQKRKEIENLIVSENYVPFEQVFMMQQHTTVNIILESKSEISPFLPGKFPHCVQADKPILLLGPYYSESRRLLGDEYEYWAENDDDEKIAQLLKKLYDSWTQNENVKLDKPELKQYLSMDYLRETINQLSINDSN